MKPSGTLKEVLRSLGTEIDRRNRELEQLTAARQALTTLAHPRSGNHGSRRHMMSAAARARISAAQKARWAVWKKKHKH